MDASRLLEVLDQIEPELVTNIEPALTELVNQLASQRANPSSDLTANVLPAYTRVEAGFASVVGTMPPSQRQILEEIGGEEFLGESGLAGFRALFQTGSVGWLTSTQAVEEYRARISAFRTKVSTTRAGLRDLGIVAHTLDIGEFEVGVLIPLSLTDSKLNLLTEWFAEWNKIVRAYAEVAGDSDREVTVTDIATGTHELFLQVSRETAQALALTVVAVTKWYKDLLEIRKLRQELKERGVPVAETKAIKEFEKQELSNRIGDLVQGILSGADLKDTPRSHELETQLTISVKRIVRFIDDGGDVEVTTGTVAPTPDGEQDEEVARIRRDGLAANELPKGRDHVFLLGDGSDAEESEEEQDVKIKPPRAGTRPKTK
jgi:hypothetical protein